LPTFACLTLLPVYLFYVIDTGLFSCLHLSVWHFYQYIYSMLQILGYCLVYICLYDTFTSIFILCYRYWAIFLPTFVCLTLLPVYLFYVIDTGLLSCLHLSVWHFYQYIYSMLQILGYSLAYICLYDTFTSIFILCYRYWAIALPTFACLTLLPVYLFYVIDTGLLSCLHLPVWHFYQYIYSML
jgi:hypothetical protein